MAWNKKKKKACKTAPQGKIKEGRKTSGEWLIGVQTQNVLYPSIVITQQKTRQRPNILIDEGKGA